MRKQLMVAALLGGLLLVAGCTTTSMQQPVALVLGPPVQSVSGPYDAAKACIAQVPEIKGVRVAVGNINDTTGKLNVAEGGTGSFITQGATDMFHSTLAEIGVQLVELSPEYRGTIDWLASKDVKGGIKTAQFIIMGSIPALDFLPGSVVEASYRGVGPKHRAYQAIGRMDVRLTTLPFGTTAGGVVVASSSVDKQFMAVETEFGVGTFVGAGTGLSYASFRIGEGKREPMQYTIGFMVDYTAVDLLSKMLEQLSAEGKIKDRRAQIGACRKLLDDPYARNKAQVAEAT